MIHIAVCDDDERDLKNIVDIIKNIVGSNGRKISLLSFASADKMLEEIEDVDIAVLDISMDELNGIELGRKLKMRFPKLKLVYITSYREYCMQAINKVHAYSFLTKPLNKEEMQNQLMELLQEVEKLQSKRTKKFYNVVDKNGREWGYIELQMNDIVYFEYLKTKRKIAIVLNEQVYEYSYTMKKLIEELKDEYFEISCRGTLVNLRHVVKIKGYNLHMDNGNVLAISQKRMSHFKESLNEFIHRNV